MTRFGALLVLCACKSTSAAPQPAPDGAPLAVAPPAPTPLPALGAPAPTTLERTWRPAVPRANEPANPGYPEALASYLARGLGERNAAPGQPATTLATDGKAHRSAAPRRLLRFVHLTDMHVADDASPSRVTAYDRREGITAALRPQESLGCSLLNAAVRTIRSLAPSFVLLGGDATDNAQQNELDWALAILRGAPRVACNAEPPFAAAGLGGPFVWVTGNHDALVQGNFEIDEAQRETTLGSVANGGTRNHAKPGAPPETGAFASADPSRALLSASELRARTSTPAAPYAWDAPDSPVRVVVLDTAHPEGGAGGVLTRRTADAKLKPLLDAALAEHKVVILAAHHGLQALTGDGGTFGRAEPDPLFEHDVLALLRSYPNVIASFVGHAHRHRVRLVRAGNHALWEITTAALIDYPNQFRLVELFDEGGGWLTLRATAVDVATDGDAAATEALRRAQVDFSAGWAPDGRGEEGERNVILWVPKPRE